MVIHRPAGPATHATHSIHHEHRSVSGGLARAGVFGVSDGLVSNISLVLGMAGGGASASVVRLAGIAGLIAGAVSMAAGEYVSVSAQNALIRRELDVEQRELDRHPEAETAELAHLYEKKGVPAGRAKAVAEDIMRDRDRALIEHARQELGVDPEGLGSPWWTAFVSFVSFCVGASIPLVPWFIGSGGGAAAASVAIGIVAAAIVGVLIGRLSERSIPTSIARHVLILVLACGVTYLVGKAVGVGVT
jgi:VIT1/CCC1 family predicted Fe2+/Mn2+ transporter